MKRRLCCVRSPPRIISKATPSAPMEPVTKAKSQPQKAFLGRICKGDLRDGFTAREVHQRGWANLSKHENVQAGLGLLCDFDWLRVEKIDTGGRPSARHHINPRAYQ
jgi:hypothetical protein